MGTVLFPFSLTDQSSIVVCYYFFLKYHGHGQVFLSGRGEKVVGGGAKDFKKA